MIFFFEFFFFVSQNSASGLSFKYSLRALAFSLTLADNISTAFLSRVLNEINIIRGKESN